MKKITSLFVFIIAVGGIFIFSNIIIVAQQPNNTLPNATIDAGQCKPKFK
ncbi:MAG: hypothetical protein H0V31_05765 [Acidobacteria bacterium]|jgi:hypothetical protein|nr:hypothetical protein [Acidobacteriota bacterium]